MTLLRHARPHTLRHTLLRLAAVTGSARRWVSALLLPLLLATGGLAHALDLGERDTRAVRAVIDAQLDAMARGDAERAFGYAAPAIRALFGDADRFMGMVREGYPMVIAPRSRAYFKAEAVEGVAGVAMQVMQFRDADDRAWLAAYQLERQADGRWRISGCQVTPDPGRPST